MELTGKIIAVLDEQRFSGKNGEIVKNSFVLETNGEYPKKVAFTVIGEERWQKMGVAVGREVSVSFDVSSREWQGRWFTEASAWKVVSLGGVSASVAPAAAPPVMVEPASEDNGGGDGLPF